MTRKKNGALDHLDAARAHLNGGAPAEAADGDTVLDKVSANKTKAAKIFGEQPAVASSAPAAATQENEEDAVELQPDPALAAIKPDQPDLPIVVLSEPDDNNGSTLFD